MFMDNKMRTIGHKRANLVADALGEYLAFVDDDDDVPAYYVDVTYCLS